jgi:ribosomal protein S18 acetylase RimI-like enzyme
MEIVQVTHVSEDLVSAFERFVPHLSSSISPPTKAELEEVVSSPSTVIFVARDPAGRGEVAGALTLALYRTPTGSRAWIEDVVVGPEHRRRGIGTALTQAALAYAKERGARTVDLTSRPSREAANRLYRGLGFTRRETNVYRFEL